MHGFHDRRHGGKLPRTLCLLLALAPFAVTPLHAESPESGFACCQALNLQARTNLDRLMPDLLDKQVVFVGETHDRYEHHLAQLEIIRRIHQVQPDMVIAMELFSQPNQAHLDDYVAGRSDEATMLRLAGYFHGNRLDYRLYRPILQFARDHAIPVLALNIPREVSHKVAMHGLAALAGDERKWLPAEIDRGNENYRKRVQASFHQHPQGMNFAFDNFLDAQLLWDEAMAARAADYLKQHPGRHMVVLAGMGHLFYGDGIPSRLARRTATSMAIVLNNPGDMLSPDIADIVLFPLPQDLPANGNLGVSFSEQDGRIRVDSLEPNSAAGSAGILAGDYLIAVAGQRLSSSDDLRLAILDKLPGDTVPVTVRRPGSLFAPEREQEIPVTLR
ncbi:MAG: ChaN family lipoprotein [Hydrogenophilaceae bacterium]